MATPLLTTKLHRPPLLPERVERIALCSRLRKAYQRKVTLVSAPVGFGKTALLADWCERNQHATAWLTLDESDNDPTRFWSYFMAGLRQLYPSRAGSPGFHGSMAEAILHASHPLPIDMMMVELINELVICEGGGFFILDDFHTIQEQSIHDALLLLVDNLPPSLHLIFATRQDPPWPLARLRASGQMIELRAADLRFSLEEATAFFNGVEHFGLLPGDIALLNTHVEGWVAGLRLVALSLRSEPDTVSFIANLSGNKRFVLDYLLDEVLVHQPKPLQDFLMKTSILDRLCAGLCDAVVGEDEARACRKALLPNAPDLADTEPASAAVLRHLETANLFVAPLDNERCWYRYHRLFADLLQSHLEQNRPSEREKLHQRASIWYEQHGHISDAIAHALTANDVDRVTHLLEGNALLTVYQGELALLTRWLDALPKELVHTRPWLAVARGWVLALTGQFQELTAHLDSAEDHMHRQAMQLATAATDTDGATSPILAHLYALRMYAHAVVMDVDTAFRYADLALRQLSAESTPLSEYINLLLGSLYHRRGELAAAEEWWLTHTTRCRAAGDLLNTVSGLAELADLQIEQGQLHRAHVTCGEALQLAGREAEPEARNISFVGRIYVILAKLQLEWNELEGALHMAHQGRVITTRWGQAEGMLSANITLAQALQAVGDAEGALAAMGRAGEIAHQLSPWHVHTQAANQAELWINQGNIAAAVTWAERSGLRLNDHPAYLRHREYLVLAQVRLMQVRFLESQPSVNKQIDAVIQLLNRLLDLCAAAGSTGTEVRVLVLMAIAHHLRKDERSALTVLARALELAEPESYIDTFLAVGSASVPLLQRWMALHGESVYVKDLLRAAHARRSFEINHVVEDDLLPVSETLSPREQEVLALLPSNLSTVEIADHLILAPSTVRTHIKSIYAKLQAHNRNQALEIARRLGWL